jgi:hypothetical protein
MQDSDEWAGNTPVQAPLLIFRRLYFLFSTNRTLASSHTETGLAIFRCRVVKPIKSIGVPYWAFLLCGDMDCYRPVNQVYG